jgi:hypothetical protein
MRGAGGRADAVLAPGGLGFRTQTSPDPVSPPRDPALSPSGQRPGWMLDARLVLNATPSPQGTPHGEKESYTVYLLS